MFRVFREGEEEENTNICCDSYQGYNACDQTSLYFKCKQKEKGEIEG